MASLRDKANLALGYAWLQANNPTAARTALERVRLSGPYSTRALLGMGWAEAALGQYREALTPWTELHGRNLLDAAVQESYLAVPYAYGKLNANAQAAEYYESAIKSFDSEEQQIDTAVARIGEGHMTDDLLAHRPPSRPAGLVLAAEAAARCAAVPLSLQPAGRQRFPGRTEELPRPGIPRRHAQGLG